MQIGGRGTAGYTMTLATNTKQWQVNHEQPSATVNGYPGLKPAEGDGGGDEVATPNNTHTYTPQWKQWNTLNVGYGAGVMQGRQTGVETVTRQTCDTCPVVCQSLNPLWRYTLTRLTFITPDGTEHELRDAHTNGKPMLVEQARCSDPTGPGAFRGKTFVSSDGSAMTFISDTDIYDRVLVNRFTGNYLFSPTGVLYLRDGTRYHIALGRVDWIEDRNGNRIEIGTDLIKDSLGRTVTVEHGVSDAQYGLHDRLTFRGFNGQARVIRVAYVPLEQALRADFGTQAATYADLFFHDSPRGLNGALNVREADGSPARFNPQVVARVWLPDNSRSYRLFYNKYGEVARVELPTGGAFEYDMVAGAGIVWSPGATTSTGEEEAQLYRRVKERRTYAGLTAETLENRTVYNSTPEPTNPYSDGPVVVEQYDKTNRLLARTRHTFNSSALDSLYTAEPGELYSAALDGREVMVETLDLNPDSNQAAMLQRVMNDFAQRESVAWVGNLETRAYNPPPPGLAIEPANDPRLIRVTTTLETNQTSRQEFGYDRFNNQTDTYDYHYGENGQPGALARRSHTDFVLTEAYTAPEQGVHLRNLPERRWVSPDAAGADKWSLTVYEYDVYAPDSVHAALVAYPSIVMNAARDARRGNPTLVTNYENAQSLPPTGAHTLVLQYDVAGNVVKVIDPRGQSSNIEYGDRFGTPDGEARAHTPPQELGGQQTYAFPTKMVNALGHETHAQYDYHLGAAVDGEDANGIVSSGSYNDPLDRPKQMTRAANAGNLRSQTTWNYLDAERRITTTSDLNTFGDNALKSETLYDGLGRTFETRRYETPTQYIATRQTYDGLGRVETASSPFRSAAPGTLKWTTTVYDALGRTRFVTTPDGARVESAYTGNQTTVTDQAGKSRRSFTNVLGHLVQVVEDPFGTTPLATDYKYDVLGNLRQVDQGGQRRFFMYDSLGRFIRAKNPEQDSFAPDATFPALTDATSGTSNSEWSLGYTYDANGNLAARKDARNIVTTYGYDALNRNRTINYSDATPGVEHRYDLAVNGKGRLASSATINSTATAETVTDEYDALGRPTVMRQLFQTNGVWSQHYYVRRSYDLAGNVTAQTYPSGRVVNYQYDAAGRTSSFSGNLGDGVARTYSSGIIYDELGGLREERFGTQTPLYNKRFYNTRGQLSEIRVGTSAYPDTGWNRGAIINHYSNQSWAGSGTDNNGNLLKSENYIPHDDQISGYDVTAQFYDYDALNRLKLARESRNGAAVSWEQAYDYDRWGNRRINQSATQGVGKRAAVRRRYGAQPAVCAGGFGAGGKRAPDAV